MKTHYTILLCSLLLFLSLVSCQQQEQGRIQTKESIEIEFMQYCSQFADYSYVDWQSITRCDTQQNKGDWTARHERLIDSTSFPLEIATDYWNLLTNARLHLHRESLPLRSQSSDEINRAIDRLEEAFLTTFEEIIGQEYYMRILPDCFDENVPEQVDEICRSLQEKNKNNL